MALAEAHPHRVCRTLLFASGLARGWEMFPRQAPALAGGESERGLSSRRTNMDSEIERRTTRRIAASLPVRTTNAALGNVLGVTRDVSLSGAFFYVASDSWKEGASIEYVLQLPEELTLAEPVLVLCTGRVVRVEQLNDKVGIAVQIESFSVLQTDRSAVFESFNPQNHLPK
jgi:PilZ domain